MSFAVPVPSAGPSAPPLSNPVVVVNSQFLSSYPVDLVISEKLMTIKEGSFAISDVNGNVMFNVKGSVLSLHDHRVLVDSAGAPIVTFRQKVHTKIKSHCNLHAPINNTACSKLLFVFLILMALDIDST